MSLILPPITIQHFDRFYTFYIYAYLSKLITPEYLILKINIQKILDKKVENIA